MHPPPPPSPPAVPFFLAKKDGNKKAQNKRNPYIKDGGDNPPGSRKQKTLKLCRRLRAHGHEIKTPKTTSWMRARPYGKKKGESRARYCVPEEKATRQWRWILQSPDVKKHGHAGVLTRALPVNKYSTHTHTHTRVVDGGFLRRHS